MITERLLNKKRHTVGFAVGAEEYTRAQTIKLAKQGQIEGVKVCKGPKGPYLTSAVKAQSLYSLPTRIVESLRKGRPAGSVAAKSADKAGAKSAPAKKANKPAKKTTTKAPKKSK